MSELIKERRLAIEILEAISDKLEEKGIVNSDIFDSKDEDDSRWYDFEDMVADIISKFNKEEAKGGYLKH